jgi:hypothetical protein
MSWITQIRHGTHVLNSQVQPALVAHQDVLAAVLNRRQQIADSLVVLNGVVLNGVVLNEVVLHAVIPTRQHVRVKAVLQIGVFQYFNGGLLGEVLLRELGLDQAIANGQIDLGSRRAVA